MRTIFCACVVACRRQTARAAPSWQNVGARASKPPNKTAGRRACAWASSLGRAGAGAQGVSAGPTHPAKVVRISPTGRGPTTHPSKIVPAFPTAPFPQPINPASQTAAFHGACVDLPGAQINHPLVPARPLTIVRTGGGAMSIALCHVSALEVYNAIRVCDDPGACKDPSARLRPVRLPGCRSDRALEGAPTKDEIRSLLQCPNCGAWSQRCEPGGLCPPRAAAVCTRHLAGARAG